LKFVLVKEEVKSIFRFFNNVFGGSDPLAEIFKAFF